jgi:hypothetical protein
MTPTQLSMFESTSPSSSPIGLSVILPKRCSNCGADAAVIGSSRGPHHASLLCDCCGRHRGWLSGVTYNFISTIIDQFGRPVEPIEVTLNSRSRVDNTTATATER